MSGNWWFAIRAAMLLLDGNQNDRVDARKLSDLLYMNKLNAVYHGDHGLRTLKELVRSYLKPSLCTEFDQLEGC